MDSGTVLAGRYRLDQLLGRGGMGEVWRCHDLRLSRNVAVKVLLGTDPDSEDVRRFRQEAEAAADLRHPGIAVVFDFDIDLDADRRNGRLFIVTELLHGQNLAGLLKKHPGGLPVGRAIGLGLEISGVLEHAHGRGIVHRDLKPSNFFVQTDGPLKILDFGIARNLNITSSVTSRGMGTPGYMSPEQWEGKPASPRMDLYSLGCVLYELLTSRLPFAGPSGPAFMNQHFYDEPTPPHNIRPGIPGELSGLVLRLLAKEPAGRPASAAVVAAELQKIQQPPGGRGNAGTLRGDRGQGIGDAWGAPRARPAAAARPAAVPGATQRAGIAHLGALSVGPDLDDIHRVDFSPDGRVLAVSFRRRRRSRVTMVQLYETRAQQPHGPPIEVPGVLVQEVNFSPNSQIQVASLSANRTEGSSQPPAVRLVNIDIASHRVVPLATGDGHKDAWEKVSFSPDGRTLLTTRHNTLLGKHPSTVVWDTASGKLIGSPFDGKRAARSRQRAFSPNGQLLAASYFTDDQCGIVLCDTRLLSLNNDLVRDRDPWAETDPIMFSPDSGTLAISSGSQVQLWDTATRRQVGPSLESPARFPRKLAFSPDGRMLVLGLWTRPISHLVHRAYAWNLSSPQPTAQPIGDLDGADTTTQQFAFSPDGHTLATLTTTHGKYGKPKPMYARLWEMPSGQSASPEFPVSDATMAFSANGRLFLARARDSERLIIWDTASRQLNAESIDKRVDKFATSPDGQVLATIDKKARTVHLWGL